MDCKTTPLVIQYQNMEKDQFVILYKHTVKGDLLTDSLAHEGFYNVYHLNAQDFLRPACKRALEEGYRYIITVNDADGFTAQDIAAVATALFTDDSKLYVGSRTACIKSGLPTAIFEFLSGMDARDADSSLLGISATLLAPMINIRSGKQVFLLNLMLEARSRSIDVIPLQTEALATRKLGFSLLGRTPKLYQLFIKFSISAMVAYIVDISSFALFLFLFSELHDEFSILISTVLSRILCSFVTYLLNKGAVFRSHARTAGAVVRFIILSVGQLLASWLLVWGLGALLGGGTTTHTILKVVVDLLIFIASFTIQRDWVFKQTDGLLK
jgi:putative flippase GtrA